MTQQGSENRMENGGVFGHSFFMPSCRATRLRTRGVIHAQVLAGSWSRSNAEPDSGIFIQNVHVKENNMSFSMYICISAYRRVVASRKPTNSPLLYRLPNSTTPASPSLISALAPSSLARAFSNSSRSFNCSLPSSVAAHPNLRWTRIFLTLPNPLL